MAKGFPRHSEASHQGSRSFSFQLFLVERRVQDRFASIQPYLVNRQSLREASPHHGNDRTDVAGMVLPALVLRCQPNPVAGPEGSGH